MATLQNKLDSSKLKWPVPWEPIARGSAEGWAAELNREAPPGHVLHGIPCFALGAGEHPDDILFQIEHPDAEFAFVHLTWSVEKNPDWPYAVLYKDFEEFLSQEKAGSEQAVADQLPAR
mgnify:CR=1 FL=1